MKKSVLLEINVDDDYLHNLAAALGCEVGSWPIKYLGIEPWGEPL